MMWESALGGDMGDLLVIVALSLVLHSTCHTQELRKPQCWLARVCYLSRHTW
jgi:hypothetical protein